MSKNCCACGDLAEHSAEFIVNGCTDNIVNSLKKDTGFNPNADVIHDDCTDLNLANDCYLGEFDTEVDAYDNCDWKGAVKELSNRLYNLLKAIISAICGCWSNIHSLSTRITKLEKTQSNACVSIKDLVGAYQHDSIVIVPITPSVANNTYVGDTYYNQWEEGVKNTIPRDKPFTIKIRRYDLTDCDGNKRSKYTIGIGQHLGAYLKNATNGETIGYVNKSEIVGSTVSSDIFDTLISQFGYMQQVGIFSDGTIFGLGLFKSTSSNRVDIKYFGKQLTNNVEVASTIRKEDVTFWV